MRRFVLSLVVGLSVAAAASAQCQVAGPYVVYHGNPFLPKINVVAGNFALGANTQVRLEAGLGFIEGFACHRKWHLITHNKCLQVAKYLSKIIQCEYASIISRR